MKKNRKQKYKNGTLKSLEAGLRNLPKLTVPASLRTKLFKTIPGTAYSSPPAWRGASLRKTWVPAAAVIFVCLLAFVLNYGSSISPEGLITEVNVASANSTVIDHNSTRIVDTNRSGLLNQ
ncbi:MAG: hypothetical protein ISS79_06955 [Phycisphaerae bacterium]|nr:hypothetical protein [Phycisphaerae bacterium]